MTRSVRRAAERGRGRTPSPLPGSDAALRLLVGGDGSRAKALAEEVLARRADDALAHQVLGIVAYQRNDLPVARDHFARVVEIDPSNADAHNNLAEALSRLAAGGDPIPVFERALELNPRNAVTLTNYSQALIDRGRYGDGAQAARAALAIKPDSVPALQNLSLAQWASGAVEEGIETARRAVRLDPGSGVGWSNLLMYLQYSAAHSAEDLLATAQAWGRTMERPRIGPPASALPEPARLKIGYVSGDFSDHPVGYGIEKVLEGHDRARVEVVLYSTSAIGDAVTRRLRARADGWRDLSGLDDEAAALTIAADGIHILIDLSGHTARHRLGVFAHRPAPVQASWLGYFGTTGLPQMDFVLRDRAQIPPDEERSYTERVWALEGAAFGYRPLPGCPELSPLPARQNGFVTFANFNNPAKISDESIRAWARVLHRVPGSRMVLDRKGLDEPAGRDRVLREFARHGIPAERLDLGASRGHLAYMARYAEVDLVLDTAPCNGATTTYEALWMGVPVVGRRWDRMVGHFAESILGPCGHADWVADDEDGYVETAVGLASDPERLATLRATLRPTLASSSLCRAGDCARSLEDAYEGMWREIRGPVEAETAAEWLDRVVPLAREGRVAEAFATFERGASLDPTLAGRRGGALFTELGKVLAAQGRHEEAAVCRAQAARMAAFR